jgi:hypothetical protein
LFEGMDEGNWGIGMDWSTIDLNCKVRSKGGCKNLDNSYFSLSLKGEIMVVMMEDSRYAINGKSN